MCAAAWLGVHPFLSNLPLACRRKGGHNTTAAPLPPLTTSTPPPKAVRNGAAQSATAARPGSGAAAPAPPAGRGGNMAVMSSRRAGPAPLVAIGSDDRTLCCCAGLACAAASRVRRMGAHSGLSLCWGSYGSCGPGEVRKESVHRALHAEVSRHAEELAVIGEGWLAGECQAHLLQPKPARQPPQYPCTPLTRKILERAQRACSKPGGPMTSRVLSGTCPRITPPAASTAPAALVRDSPCWGVPSHCCF